jgi:hypothetical protein
LERAAEPKQQLFFKGEEVEEEREREREIEIVFLHGGIDYCV